MNRLKKHPVLASLALTLCLTALWCILTGSSVWEALVYTPFIGIFCFYPFTLTALNLAVCFVKHPDENKKRAISHIEAVTLILGILFSLLLIGLLNIDFTADWPETLTGAMTHTPVWTKASPTVLTFLALGLGGFWILRAVPLKIMPPLAMVLSISAMYLGMIQCVLWIIQIFTLEDLEIYLCLLPLNWIFMCIRLMRQKVGDWKTIEETEKRSFDNHFLEKLNRKVMDSDKWPLWAFLLAWPLAGLAVMILALFGQRPDNMIRAWTETSQWNLSTRISPPNVVYDEHYLCTVAAGGHRKLVKPLRMGVRRGHTVVVNRQLCIANAFEQILQERMPRLHKVIRHVYDTWGFPLARLIRTPWAADGVYVLMKPLEWLFLTVIYLTDARPEDRIRLQYITPMPEKK